MDNRQTAAAAPQEVFIRSALSDLNYAVKRVDDICERARGIADRLQGPAPEAPTAGRSGAISSVPTNITDEIRDRLSVAQEKLTDLERHIGRIESFV